MVVWAFIFLGRFLFRLHTGSYSVSGTSVVSSRWSRLSNKLSQIQLENIKILILEIGRYLRTYCHQNQGSWNRFLSWAKYAQNSLRQDTTGLTPFQCILWYQPPLFPWSGELSEVPAVNTLFEASERVWDSAHIHLQRAVRRHQSQADTRRGDTPQYQPGQKVWLSTRDIRLRLPCRKLSPRYIGPFTIERQVNEVTYRLHLPSHYRIAPSFHVSLLKPFTDPLVSPFPGPDGVDVPPPPEVAEEESIHRVQEILDSRRLGRRLEYLIDWEGYGPEERSWVPRDDILDPSLLTQFHNSHPNRPAPRGRGRPRRRVTRASASGAARGGGGTVTESPVTPATPSESNHPTPPIRSLSPDY
uniref:Chromo domain-containing protein n=1 Tax=Cyprinus carpio carpio TaxID=630221 RepID=A0A9J8B9S0_CYPCA